MPQDNQEMNQNQNPVQAPVQNQNPVQAPVQNQVQEQPRNITMPGYLNKEAEGFVRDNLERTDRLSSERGTGISVQNAYAGLTNKQLTAGIKKSHSKLMKKYSERSEKMREVLVEEDRQVRRKKNPKELSENELSTALLEFKAFDIATLKMGDDKEFVETFAEKSRTIEEQLRNGECVYYLFKTKKTMNMEERESIYPVLAKYEALKEIKGYMELRSSFILSPYYKYMKKYVEKCKKSELESLLLEAQASEFVSYVGDETSTDRSAKAQRMRTDRRAMSVEFLQFISLELALRNHNVHEGSKFKTLQKTVLEKKVPLWEDERAEQYETLRAERVNRARAAKEEKKKREYGTEGEKIDLEKLKKQNVYSFLNLEDDELIAILTGEKKVDLTKFGEDLYLESAQMDEAVKESIRRRIAALKKKKEDEEKKKAAKIAEEEKKTGVHVPVTAQEKSAALNKQRLKMIENGIAGMEGSSWVLGKYLGIKVGERTLKDSLVEVLGNFFQSGKDDIIDPADNEMLTRLLLLFNARVQQHTTYIENLVDNGELFDFTYGNKAFAEKIKYGIAALVGSDLLLPMSKEQENNILIKSSGDDFLKLAKNEDLEKKYQEFSRVFPVFAKNREFMKSQYMQGLFALKKDRFDHELAVLEEQTAFYDSVIMEQLSDTNLSGAGRRAMYKKIRAALGDRYLSGSLSDVRILTDSFIKNPSSLYLLSNAELKKFRRLRRTDPKDSRFSYRGMVLRDMFFDRSPLKELLSDISDDEKMGILLEAVRSNTSISEKYPRLLADNEESLEALSYEELSRVTEELFDIVMQYGDSLFSWQTHLGKVRVRFVLQNLLNGENFAASIFKSEEAAKKYEQEKLDRAAQRDAVFTGSLLGVRELEKNINYRYENSVGESLWFEKFKGIRIREGRNVVDERIRRHEAAHKAWELARSLTIAVSDSQEEGWEVVGGGESKSLTAVIRAIVVADSETKNVLSGRTDIDSLLSKVGVHAVIERFAADYGVDSGLIEGRVKKFFAEVKKQAGDIDISNEFMLLDAGYDMFSADGEYGSRLLDNDEEGYKRALGKSSSVIINRVSAVQRKIESRELPADAERRLERFISGMKDGAPESEADRLRNEKYNLEHFGVKNFEEALDKYVRICGNEELNTESNQKQEALSRNIEKLLKHNDGEFAPLAKGLIRSPKVLAALGGTDEEVDKFIDKLSEGFKPFEKASRSHFAFIMEQYISQNFDAIETIFLQKKPATADEWSAILNKHEDMLMNAKIEGRDSLNERLEDIFKYADHLNKNGSAIITYAAQTDPEFFDLLVRDRKKLDKYVKDYITLVEERSKRMASENISDELTTDYEAKDALVQGKIDKVAKKFERRADFLKNLEKSIDDLKKSGIEKDKGFETIRKLNVKIAERPSVFLDEKTGKGYTQDKAEASMTKVDAALEKLKLKERVPVQLKTFLSEYIFANTYVDLNNEILYLMGVYLNLRGQIKFVEKDGKKLKDEDLEFKASRAAIWTFLHTKSHKFDEKTERYRFYDNTDKDRILKNGKVEVTSAGIYKAIEKEIKAFGEPDNSELAGKELDEIEAIFKRYDAKYKALKTKLSDRLEGMKAADDFVVVTEEAEKTLKPIAGESDWNVRELIRITGDKSIAYRKINGILTLTHIVTQSTVISKEENGIVNVRESKVDLIEEFDVDTIDLEKLDEVAQRRLKLFKKDVKEQKAKKEKREKEEKKLAKQFIEDVKFETKNPGKLIPKLDVTGDAVYRDFKEVDELNQKLSVMPAEIKHPYLVAEYKDFTRAAGLAAFTMSRDEFVQFVTQRLRYFSYASKVYQKVSEKIDSHYEAIDQAEKAKFDKRENDILAAKKKSHPKTQYAKKEYAAPDHTTAKELELNGFIPLLREKIIEDLEKTEGLAVPEIEAKSLESFVATFLENKEYHRLLIAQRVSSEDLYTDEKYYYGQKGFDDVCDMISRCDSKELRDKFRTLSYQEKFLFAAALSLGSPADFDATAGTILIIDKTKAEQRLKEVNEAYQAFISGKSEKISVDFEAALTVLYDKKGSAYNPLEKKLRKLTGQKDKVKLNEKAFDAAFAIVQAARSQQEQKGALELTVLGDPKVSIKYAEDMGYHHSTRLALMDNRPQDLKSFRTALNTIANADKVRFRADDSLRGALGKLNRKKLLERLVNLDDSQLRLLVTVLQDRTVLDYKTASVTAGETVERVNAEKRGMIKSQYLAAKNMKLNLLEKSGTEASVVNALTTLLSFQLRDDIAVTGTSVNDFAKSSFDRTTLIDWSLLDEAFVFMDELELEDSRLATVRKSSEWIEASGNEQAKEEYRRLKDRQTREGSFKPDAFLEVLNSNAVSDNEKDLVFGYESLSEEDKALFIRALKNRDILDISCKNRYKTLTLGLEQDYVNEDGRYALIDEYVHFSRNGSSLVVDKEGHFAAMRSLLSTQVADDLSKKEMTSVDVAGKLVDRRDTAIDWNLFRNALQFVNRARLEKNSYYEDSELLRSLGDYEKVGAFTFNYGLVRKNLNSRHSRFSRFLAGRARKKLMDIIPTGNMKTLMGLVLSTRQMNEVNKSGILLNGTGSASAEARNEVLAKKVDKRIEAYNENGKKIDERMETVKAQIDKFEGTDVKKRTGDIDGLREEYAQLKLEKTKNATKKSTAEKERLALIKGTATERKEKQELLDIIEKSDDQEKVAAAKKKYTEITGVEFYVAEKEDGLSVVTEDKLSKAVINSAVEEEQLDGSKAVVYKSTNKLDTLIKATKMNALLVGMRLGELCADQTISVSFEKTDDAKLVTAVWTLQTEKEIPKERYDLIQRNFLIALKEAEKLEVDDATGLTERELVNEFAEKMGLKNYYENATAITELFGGMGIFENHPELEKYGKSLTAIHDNIKKVVIMCNSQRGMSSILTGFDPATFVDLAENINKDAGENDTAKTYIDRAKTAAELYKTATKAFNDLKEAYDNFTEDISTDKKVLALMSEQDLGSVIKVFSKYDESGKVQLMADTMSGLKTLGGKINKLVNLMGAKKLAGDEDGLIDDKNNVVSQLGIDDLCDVVALYTKHFEKDGRASALVEKSKDVALMIGNIMKTVKKNAKTEAKDNKAIREYKYDDSLSAEENEKALKALKDKAESDEVAANADLTKAVDLKAAGEMLAAFMSDKTNIEETKKYANLVNVLKDQIADIYVQFNSKKEWHEDITKLNLKSFKAAIDTLDKKGSKEGWLYAAGNTIYTTTRLTQNVCSLMFKYGDKHFKTEDGRDIGESYTKKMGTEGVLETRMVSDILAQSGVDDILAIFETIGQVIPIDKVNTIVADVVEVKNKGIELADKIQKAVNGDVSGLIGDNGLTDIGLDQLSAFLEAHGSEMGAELVKETKTYLDQAANVYKALSSDKDLFDQLAEIDISKMAEQLKDTKLGSVMNYVSIAKDIYNAGHGLVYDAQGVYKYFVNSFSFSQVGTDYSGKEFMLKMKDRKFVGDRIKKLYESGKLEKMIKAGTMVKDNVGNVVDMVMGVYHGVELRNADLDAEVYDEKDEVMKDISYEQQNKAIKGDKYKISEDEKKLTEKSMERNKETGKLGLSYGYEKMQDSIINLIFGVGSSATKVFSGDPTGTLATVVKDAGEFVKFFNKALTDDKVISQYIIHGVGREQYEKYREHVISTGRDMSESALVKGTLNMMGFKNAMEARTFVGRQIVQSLLFAATDVNMLQGIKMRAKAVLKMVGKEDLAGRMDEGAQSELYDSLVGAI